MHGGQSRENVVYGLLSLHCNFRVGTKVTLSLVVLPGVLYLQSWRLSLGEPVHPGRVGT